MSPVLRVSVAALCLLTSVFVAMAQDSRISDWLAVSPHSAGIVLSIDFPISKATISNDKGDVLAAKQWIPKIPLIWQLRVQPDAYQIRLEEGPIWSLGVIAKQPGGLTYVRLARYHGSKGEIGLSATVSQGPVPSQLTDYLETAAKIGIPEAFSIDTIGPGNRILLVSTEPPWKIPPPPPPGK